MYRFVPDGAVSRHSPAQSFHRFSLITADSRLCPEKKTKHLGSADFSKKPQIFVGKCRKLQEPAENLRLVFVPLRFVPFSRALTGCPSFKC